MNFFFWVFAPVPASLHGAKTQKKKKKKKNIILTAVKTSNLRS
jgi:hypothetical protein